MKATDIMIIGQSPGHKPGSPLDVRSEKRLVTLLQLESRKTLHDECKIINLLNRAGTTAWERQVFPKVVARRAANDLKAERPIVLMCGHSIAHACKLYPYYQDFFKPCAWRGGVAVVIPHPGGLSQWWEDADNQKLATEFFKDMLTKGVEPNTWPLFSPKKFKRLITKRRTSQKKLAEGIQRSEHAVGRWARGQTKPDVDDFYAIMWFLACDAADLAE